MNKKIISIILFMTSFFFFSNNVGAADYALQINSEDIPKNYFYTLEQIPSDYQDQIETAYNYFGIDYENDNYIISYDTLNKDLICFKWNKDISYKVEPSVALKQRTSTQWIMDWFVSLNGDGYYYKYDFRDTINNVKQTTNGSDHNMITYSTSSSNGYELIAKSYSQFRMIESTVDFKFSDYVYGDKSYPRATSLSICDTELCYPVLLDSIIFTKTLEPSWIEEMMKIKIDVNEVGYTDETKKERIYEKLKVTFSLFDTTKYNYKWKSSIDNIWEEIDDNIYYMFDENGSFEYTNTLNQTLYFVVEDKEENHISSMTYTSSGILEKIPSVKWKVDIPEHCNVGTEEDPIYACKSITAKLINYNPLKHLTFYSYDGVNYENFYPNVEKDYEVYELLTHNSCFYIRFTDKETGVSIDESFCVTDINEEYDTDTPNVKFSTEFDKTTQKVKLTSMIYAYDENLYNYYYSSNGGSEFKEIEEYEYEYLSSTIRKKIEYYDENTIIVIKITDKSGNFINSFSYKINFELLSEEANKEDNFFTKIVNKIYEKFPIIEQSYTIYKIYTSYNFDEEKPKMPTINLSFLGIDKNFEIFDFTFYDKYRDLVHKYIKLSLGIYTITKLYKIVKSYFGGGK